MKINLKEKMKAKDIIRKAKRPSVIVKEFEPAKYKAIFFKH
jgi:hypothetical protein